MTLRAPHLEMLPQQRVIGFRVIESLIHLGSGNFFPSGGVVTALACLREAAVVGVGVAVRTLAEGDAGVTRLTVRTRRVALRARHAHV